MNPAIALLTGAVLIWLVANGKAGDIWRAAFGTSSTPTRPPDPSTSATPPTTTPGRGNIPPGATSGNSSGGMTG